MAGGCGIMEGERGSKRMIHIKFYRSGDRVHMDVQGHAGTGQNGADLVCAAATMLTYTLAQAVQFLSENDKLEERPRMQIADGYAHISVIPKKCALAEVLIAYWTVQAGAFVLERNYPQAVSLVPMEVAGW